MSAVASLPQTLTVRENLRVFARMYGLVDPEPRIEYLLERVHHAGAGGGTGHVRRARGPVRRDGPGAAVPHDRPRPRGGGLRVADALQRVIPEIRPTAWGRISAVMLRQIYLYKRTLHRWLEAVYWPVLDITLWGFLASYIEDTEPQSRIGFGLLGALISWDILFRAQQSVSVGFLED